MKNILITGGAGFIGSHVVRRFVTKYVDYHIFNLDALTYAGNLENLKDLEKKKKYFFIKGDINDREFIDDLFEWIQQKNLKLLSSIILLIIFGILAQLGIIPKLIT